MISKMPLDKFVDQTKAISFLFTPFSTTPLCLDLTTTFAVVSRSGCSFPVVSEQGGVKFELKIREKD